MSRIVLAGGSGFLGGVLAEYFSARGQEVVVLTRAPRSPGEATGAIREVAWDGETVTEWAHELDGARAVINLAGRSVDCRYTATNRRLIMDSRVHSTRVLGEAIARCQEPPRAWLNSSTATIYRHVLDRAWDESGEIGATPEVKDTFSIEVARAWEQALEEAPTPHTRKVALRTTMVLGAGANSVFPVLRRLVRLGLGGRMGSGRQFVSWIHADDFCRALEWILDRDGLSGALNVAAPNPLPNVEMMRALRQVCGAPLGIGLPATATMLELGAFFLRTETELILKSRRVVPGLLLADGFSFAFPTFREAVRDLEARLSGERAGVR